MVLGGQLFHALDGGVGLLGPPVHEQPARAFRKVLAHEQHDQAQHRAEDEHHPPRVAGRQVVDHAQGEQGGQEGPGPVAAVDPQVDPAPVAGGHQFVDGGVDGGVLATDAHAGDEPGAVEEDDPALAVPRGGGGAGTAQQVDAESDHEQPAPAQLVGQMAEDQSAGHFAQQVDGADGEGHRGRAHVEGGLFADDVGHVGGDGDLEAVQDPGHPQGDDHHGVELRPAQPVDTGRHQAFDGLPVGPALGVATGAGRRATMGR